VQLAFDSRFAWLRQAPFNSGAEEALPWAARSACRRVARDQKSRRGRRRSI